MSKSVVEFAVRAYFLLASIVCMVLVLKPQTLHIVSVPFSKVYVAANASHSCPAEPVCSCDSTPPVSVTSSVFDDEKESMATNPRMLTVVVNDKDYMMALSFRHEKYLEAKALEFCAENQQGLRAPMALLKTECQRSIARHVKGVLADESLLPVHFDDLIPSSVDVDQVTFPPDTYLLRQGGYYYAKVVLVDGRDYVLTFGTSSPNTSSLAETFCYQKARELGYKRKGELLEACVPTIRAFLDAELGQFREREEREREEREREERERLEEEERQRKRTEEEEESAERERIEAEQREREETRGEGEQQEGGEREEGEESREEGKEENSPSSLPEGSSDPPSPPSGEDSPPLSPPMQEAEEGEQAGEQGQGQKEEQSEVVAEEGGQREDEEERVEGESAEAEQGGEIAVEKGEEVELRIGGETLLFPLPPLSEDYYEHAEVFCEAHWESLLSSLFAKEGREGGVRDCALSILQQVQEGGGQSEGEKGEGGAREREEEGEREGRELEGEGEGEEKREEEREEEREEA